VLLRNAVDLQEVGLYGRPISPWGHAPKWLWDSGWFFFLFAFSRMKWGSSSIMPSCHLVKTYHLAKGSKQRCQSVMHWKVQNCEIKYTCSLYRLNAIDTLSKQWKTDYYNHYFHIIYLSMQKIKKK
jgi:hypothetical protein